MGDLCNNCGKTELRTENVRLSGVVRSQPYEVEMLGLKCPNCAYSTVDAKGMTEFSRLLSDKWRAEHGLLTSEQIIVRRDKYKESQEQFAKRCKIGIATLKRIEKGKIQDIDTNRRILENTEVLVVNAAQYAYVANEESTVFLFCIPGVSPTGYAPIGTQTQFGTNYLFGTGVYMGVAEPANTPTTCGSVVFSMETSQGRDWCVTNAVAPTCSAINPAVFQQ